MLMFAIKFVYFFHDLFVHFYRGNRFSGFNGVAGEGGGAQAVAVVVVNHEHVFEPEYFVAYFPALFRKTHVLLLCAELKEGFA